MMPTLVELEAFFVRHEPRDGHEYHVHVDTLAEAQGIWFLCPKCFAANNGPVGTHGVLCWFEGRIDDLVQPGPGRWNPHGTSLADLSFVPGKRSHSVALLSGCEWHGYVSNGNAE